MHKSKIPPSLKATGGQSKNQNFNLKTKNKEFDIDPKKETEKIIHFIRKTVKRTGFERVVVAVSGGIDSSTVLALCVLALGRKNVLVLKLPCGKLNKKLNKDTDLITQNFDLPIENVIEIDIRLAVEQIQSLDKTLLVENQKSESKISEDLIRKGNIMARTRMIFLYDIAKKLNALVCGTENKSEYLLGYFTRFGDEASDLEPIRHLYKTEVKKLAKYLNIPEKIFNKKPTAGLWNGQSDEQEMGFAYGDADRTLFLRFNQGLDWRAIKTKIRKNKLGIKDDVYCRIKEWVEKNWFKKETPYSLSN